MHVKVPFRLQLAKPFKYGGVDLCPLGQTTVLVGLLTLSLTINHLQPI
jgi:hypothetical protein